MSDRTGGELIGDFLATFDIPYVFGNPGTTETTFLAAVAASKATYILALHESSAVGVAAGYALITGKPSIVSLHTYPGLANGMFNMRNALMAGVPMLVINGQQDSRFLIHNPVLGAPNTRLAETATKYAYEVTSADDLTVALQRCYLQAKAQPSGPVFLSIPMNFMLDRTANMTFKATRVIDDVVPRSVGEVVRALTSVPSGKLAVVTDYAVGAAHAINAINRIATALNADIYTAPFHVQGTVNPLHPNYRGQLPPTTREINQALGNYHTMLLIGEKVDTFTYDGRQALPGELQVIQLAPVGSQLGFDFPCDIAVLGDILATLEAIAGMLEAESASTTVADRAVDQAALEAEYSASGERPSDSLILSVLQQLNRENSRHHRGLVRRCDRAGYRGAARLPQCAFLPTRRWFGLGNAAGCRNRPRDRTPRHLLCRGWRKPVLHPCNMDRGKVSDSRDVHMLCEPRVSPAEGPVVSRDGNDNGDEQFRRYGFQRPGREPGRNCRRFRRTHREDQRCRFDRRDSRSGAGVQRPQLLGHRPRAVTETRSLGLRPSAAIYQPSQTRAARTKSRRRARVSLAFCGIN